MEMIHEKRCERGRRLVRLNLHGTVAAELLVPVADVFGVTLALYEGSGALVAAAGPDRARVPLAAKPGGPAQETMARGFQLVVDRSHGHPLCATCPEAPTCPVAVELYTPVVLAGQVVGALGILTCDRERGRGLAGQRAELLQLLRQLADGIALRVQALELPEQIRRLQGQLRHLVGLIEQPTLVVGPDLTVVACNAEGARVVQLPPSACSGQPLGELMPAAVVDACRTGRVRTGIPVGNWLCDVRPMGGRGESLGTLLVFREEANSDAGRPPRRQRPFTFDDLRGGNPAFVAVKDMARRVARSEATVLIRGESGTGKELFARAIHSESGRTGPFVAVNCGAIPEHLLESELFGYEEGAFTGARRGGKPGKFELADGGTLFLDEIGDMPLYLQAKLLRVLQFKEVERVGATRPIPVDFRLIAATHRPLEEMVAEGTFRSDLYYRISVIQLEIPPLRERKDDLYILLELFAKRLSLKTGQPVKRWSAEALSVIFQYPWPGNVRELENMVEHAWLVETGEMFRVESLPPRIQRWAEQQQNARRSPPVSPAGTPVPSVRPAPVAPPAPAPAPTAEEQRILAALAQSGTTTKGKEVAARVLGMSRATLYRRLKQMRARGIWPVDAG